MNDNEWIAYINRELRFRRKMLKWQIINVSIALATFIAFVIALVISYR